MAAHTKEQRAFIIARLAAFYPASDIVDLFRKKWTDTDCTDQDVHACDPQQLATLSPEEWAVFKSDRDRVIANPELSAPAAQKMVRVIMLNRFADRAADRNSFPEAARFLEQIRVELEGDSKGGGGFGGGPGPEGEVVRIERKIVYPKPAEPVK